MNKTTKTACSYCGTGCGIELTVNNNQIISLEGDKTHPANFGMLCTKGRTLHETVNTPDRLLTPKIRTSIEEPFRDSSWDEVLKNSATKFADIIKEHGPDSVAFYVSGQLLTEDYYVFNKLMKGFIGSNNIDTNSRLCMSSAVSAYKRAFGVDGPPTTYEDIDLADSIFIIGANPAYNHPIVFRRMEQAKEKNPNLKIIVADPRKTASTSIADLHLQLKPGTDVILMQAMMNVLLWEDLIDQEFINKHTNGFEGISRRAEKITPKKAAAITGLKASEIVKAAYIFGRGKTLSFWTMGLNQSTSGTDKNNALINLHLATGNIGKPGCGPFSLTGQPNAMGGREVGGLANALPAHRDLSSKKDRIEVAKLWNSPSEISPTPGYTATELFEALDIGKVKALWIACTNPMVSIPDTTFAEKALRKAELVMVSEVVEQTDTTNFAHIILPASGWSEKEGTVTNSERSITHLNQALASPGDTLPDWEIVKRFAIELGKSLGTDWRKYFNYEKAEDIFNEHIETTRGRDMDITGLSYGLLDTKGPQRWPYPEGATNDSARLYTDFKFETPDGRANFIDIEYKEVFEPVDTNYPFSLTTGRVRDQWHTMTKTGRVPSLMQHVPMPRLSMNPKDAKTLNLNEGDLVEVTSRYGNIIAPLRLTEDIGEGVLFMPMHWGDMTGKGSRVNNLIASAVDPISKEPEFKHSAVSITPFESKWKATIMLAGEHIELGREIIKNYSYGFVSCMGQANPVTWINIADTSDLGLSVIDTRLNIGEDIDSLTYNDNRHNIHKRAWIKDNKVFAIRFTGSSSSETDWLRGLMLEGTDISDIRPYLLSPEGPLSKVDTKGEIICACKNIGRIEIEKAIEEGAETVEGIKSVLAAGTGCGSCVPEIKDILSR